METEIQGSSPLNSIDHIDMNSLKSDSDEEEYVTGISHTNEISYTDGILYIDGISHIDIISHDNGIPHTDGISHADMMLYPYMISL
jgi:hypothetical protein